MARREIILAAGTIGSAQLLMVSGVGPEEHLREVGIKPVMNLPVGYNLQDHVTFSGNAFLVNDSSLCVNDVSIYICTYCTTSFHYYRSSNFINYILSSYCSIVSYISHEPCLLRMHYLYRKLQHLQYQQLNT